MLKRSEIYLGQWLGDYLAKVQGAMVEPEAEAATTVARKPDIAFEYNYKGLYHNQVFKHVYLSGLPWLAEHLVDINDFLGEYMFEPFSWHYFCAATPYPHGEISPLRMVTALACDERERSSYIRHRTKLYGGGREEGEPMIDAVLYRQFVEVADAHLLTAAPKPLSAKVRDLWPKENRFAAVQRCADKIIRKLDGLEWHGPAEQQSYVTVCQCEYAGMFMMLGEAALYDVGKELLVAQVEDPQTRQAILETYSMTPLFVARDGHKVLFHRDKFTLKTWFVELGDYLIFRYRMEAGDPGVRCLSGVEIYARGRGE